MVRQIYVKNLHANVDNAFDMFVIRRYYYIYSTRYTNLMNWFKYLTCFSYWFNSVISKTIQITINCIFSMLSQWYNRSDSPSLLLPLFHRTRPGPVQRCEIFCLYKWIYQYHNRLQSGTCVLCMCFSTKSTCTPLLNILSFTINDAVILFQCFKFLTKAYGVILFHI